MLAESMIYFLLLMRISIFRKIFGIATVLAMEEDVLLTDVHMNKCQGRTFMFTDTILEKITANAHCSHERIVFDVLGSSIDGIDGVYEQYGQSDDVFRYEKTLPNRTVVSIRRHSFVNEKKLWLIGSGEAVFYFIVSSANQPPRTGWRNRTHIDFSSSSLVVVKHTWTKNVHLKDVLELTDETPVFSAPNYVTDSYQPTVGRELGLKLRAVYKSNQPFESISLDGLMRNDLLLQSVRSILSSSAAANNTGWIGPEETKGCCAGKYRLPFDALPHLSGYVSQSKGVVLIEQDATTDVVRVESDDELFRKSIFALPEDANFIRFLEGLTGIEGLFPISVRKQANHLVSHGCSLISVRRGGHLHVHNDFDRMLDFHRRVTVMLYLNEEWEDIWQGHIELWDNEMRHCVHRISPLFGRMVIFTNTDDSFHGHPEPLATPEGLSRLAMQFIYFTKTPPTEEQRYPPRHFVVDNSTGKVHKISKSKRYRSPHSAVFQVECNDDNNFAEHCSKINLPLGDSRFCECYNI